jgi:type I restriction enzyme, S subunit
MSAWPFVKLGAMAEFKNGLNFSSKSWGRGLKVIGVTDFQDYFYPRYNEVDEINPNGVVRKNDYLEEGDVLFVRSNGNPRLIGRSLFISGLPERMSHSGFTIRLRFTSDEIHKLFYVYIFKSSLIRSVLSIYGGGTNISNLNQGILENLYVPLPPLPTQRKIAAILSAYDELIENNRRRIALLEKLAEEIYREWFVRLRFPGHEKVKLVKGRPETWSERKFGSFCVLQRGHDLPDADVVPGPYPIIASTSIKGFHSEFKALPPVVTTGRSGSLGVVLMTHTKAWPLNTALYVKDFCGNSAFLVYYTLKNMGLEKFNAGAGVPSLNRNHLTGIKINVPDALLQKHFDDLVGPIHEQKEQLVKMNEALCKTRDLLLPRLISGKLSVEELDIQFPPGMTEE